MKSTFHGIFGTRCSTSHNNVRPSIMGVNFPDLRRRFPQKVRVPPYVLRSIVDTPAKLKNSLNMLRPWLLPPYTSPKRKLINQWQPNGDASGTDIGPFCFFIWTALTNQKATTHLKGSLTRHLTSHQLLQPRRSIPMLPIVDRILKRERALPELASFVWHAPGFGVHGNQKQPHEDLNGESGKSVMELKYRWASQTSDFHQKELPPYTPKVLS